ncbi:metallophosphoesterase [Nonomuraea sp. NPDC050556]|uniref:metallophosphoesterase n=1 Tax=Nonomuraea sp. NPDC050556 TaxID=3364369 RepID=UPI0037982ECF
MILGFAATVFVVVAVVHYYLWRRLVRGTTLPGRARRVLTWVLVGLGLLVPATLVGSRLGEGHWLAWPGFMWLAIMFYLVVFLVVLEIPRALALLAIRRSERAQSADATALGTTAADVAAAAAPTGSLSGVSSAAGADLSPGIGTTSASPGTAPTGVSSAGSVGAAVSAGSPAGVSSAGSAGRGSVELGATTTAADQDRQHPDVSRRLFLGRATALAAGVAAISTVGYGVRTALGDPVIERVTVPMPALDPRLNGLRFAVVSDIHLGPITGITHTQRIVRMINELEADVVTIVGDLVDGTVRELGHLAKPLKSLESSYGSYFVTGNHEYYTANGPDEWVQELDQLGVRSLRNERTEITHKGAVLDLAGVNDVNGDPDFDKALGGRDTSRPVVLMAHQPVQVKRAAEFGVDLQLSGHTHGGQMVPFNLVVPLQQPVVSGLATVDDVQVYVTRGAGFWGPPVRVGAPPEITMLEFKSV